MDTSLIAKLRNITGCGMMDCKNALEEAGGDLDCAVEELRKKGIAKAGKRGERETSEGVIATYIHSNKKMGVMLELLCETDFVARNEDFQIFANDLAMHIAASNPLYLTAEDVPEEVLNKEREIYTEEMKGQGKPDDVIAKIVDGKIAKFYQEVCLLNQKYIKDEDKTVEELIKEKINVIGENLRVRRFSRFEI